MKIFLILFVIFLIVSADILIVLADAIRKPTRRKAELFDLSLLCAD